MFSQPFGKARRRPTVAAMEIPSGPEVGVNCDMRECPLSPLVGSDAYIFTEEATFSAKAKWFRLSHEGGPCVRRRLSR